MTDRFIDADTELAIGDEALRLKARDVILIFWTWAGPGMSLPEYLLLGSGQRGCDYFEKQPQMVHYLHQTLLAAKALGLKSMSEICRLAEERHQCLRKNWKLFRRLDYDLDAGRREKFESFFRYLHKFGEFDELPQLRFI